MDNLVKPASAADTPAQNYEGIYLRNNLDCTGKLPATGQFAQCPDIIGSGHILLQPNTLASLASWDEMYDVQPIPGNESYYYLRGKCGGFAESLVEASLYYAPANLLLHPAVWQSNPVNTKDGGKTVNMIAQPGEIAVGPEPFVLPADSAPNASFYSFVAQLTGNNAPNPIPAITSWSDMNALLQNLGFGFRTTSHFNGSNFNWTDSVNFSIPEGITDPGELTFTITTQGLSGCTITMISPVVLPNGNTLQYGPQPVTSNNFQGSIQATIPARYSCLFDLSIYNSTGASPASGSTLNLSVGYMASPSGVKQEGSAIPIQEFILLGEVTFIVQ